MKAPPFWATKAANQLHIPIDTKSFGIDLEELFLRLIRLQLAAYRRGQLQTKKEKRNGNKNT